MSDEDDPPETIDMHTQSVREGGVDVRGAAGVQVGDSNTQVNYIYRGLTEATGHNAPLTVVAGTVDSPYQGLGYFDQQDAPFFHGRDIAVAEITHRLRNRLDEPGVLMVSGVSGAWKSSILRAGVLARLRGSDLKDAPGSHTWPAMVLTPGHSPLAELALRTTEFLDTDAATLASTLATDPAQIALAAAQIAHSTDHEHGRLVIVVDQFEQVFTHCTAPGRRAGFVDALHAAATVGHGPSQAPAALVVLVVRADFEARCSIEFPVLEDPVQNRYLGGPGKATMDLHQAAKRRLRPHLGIRGRTRYTWARIQLGWQDRRGKR